MRTYSRARVFMFVLCICELLASCRCIHYLHLRPSLRHPRHRRRRHRRCFQPPRTPPQTLRVSVGRPCGDEHRKMRVIKGKIFLCPLIGGCRGNTRATSASNYFQTLRIERALPRAAGIARHTHTHHLHTYTYIFPYLPSFSSVATIQRTPSFPRHSLAPSSPSRVLIVDG